MVLKVEMMEKLCVEIDVKLVKKGRKEEKQQGRDMLVY